MTPPFQVDEAQGLVWFTVECSNLECRERYKLHVPLDVFYTFVETRETLKWHCPCGTDNYVEMGE